MKNTVQLIFTHILLLLPANNLNNKDGKEEGHANLTKKNKDYVNEFAYYRLFVVLLRVLTEISLRSLLLLSQNILYRGVGSCFTVGGLSSKVSTYVY